MAGWFWAGGVLVNSQYVTHLEKAQAGSDWYIKVKVHGVNADGTGYIALGQTFTSEADAEVAMVAIAAGTYTE